MRDGTDRDITRDLRPYPARSEMPYVTALTNVLHQTLGWHRARMSFMARFVLCSLQLTTTNLRRIAVSLKAGVKESSNYRRIRRFLAGYDLDYAALSTLLIRPVPQEPPYVLVLDRTEWHFGQTPVNVLMIGIAHRGIAFPIAWTALPKSGGSGSEEQIEVLGAALRALDAEEVEALTADREFISVSWMKRLQAASIPFAIRLRSDRRLRLGEEGPALPAKMYARGLAIGESRVVGSRRLDGSEEASVPVRVIVQRVGSDAQPLKDRFLKDRFLVLATSGLDPTRGPALYRRRWEVETLFAALKSRGFDLKATHLTAPGRIRRLIGLLAVAFAWSHLVGEKRAETEGPPSRKAHRRRSQSLFRYGLDRLQSILTTLERQRAAFDACLQALRTPTRFCPVLRDSTRNRGIPSLYFVGSTAMSAWLNNCGMFV